MNENLKIDEEFKNVLPQLTEEEFDRLEKLIISDGKIINPIVVWNDTIVDGHNRWAIIQKHPDIPYTVEYKEFANRWEAIDWIVSNQLGRRNCTDEQRMYALGKLYEARKHVHGGDRRSDSFSRRQNGALDRPGRVREQIMKEQGVGQKTVERSEQYAKGIDAIREADAELAESILKSEKKVQKQDVQRIGTAEPEEREEMIEAIMRGEKIEKPTQIRKRQPYNTKQDRLDREELKGIINGLYDNSSIEYTIDNLTEQIKTNADAFIRFLSNLIMDHRDVCEENLNSVIKAIDESITTRINFMKERMTNGTQL